MVHVIETYDEWLAKRDKIQVTPMPHDAEMAIDKYRKTNKYEGDLQVEYGFDEKINHFVVTVTPR